MMREIRTLEAPTTRRLIVFFHCEPGAGSGRLRLAEWRGFFDNQREPVNVLELAAPWRSLPSGEARLGSWARYRLTVAQVRETIAELGWSLTAPESRLLEALESCDRAGGSRLAA